MLLGAASWPRVSRRLLSRSASALPSAPGPRHPMAAYACEVKYADMFRGLDNPLSSASLRSDVPLRILQPALSDT